MWTIFHRQYWINVWNSQTNAEMTDAYEEVLRPPVIAIWTHMKDDKRKEEPLWKLEEDHPGFNFYATHLASGTVVAQISSHNLNGKWGELFVSLPTGYSGLIGEAFTLQVLGLIQLLEGMLPFSESSIENAAELLEVIY